MRLLVGSVRGHKLLHGRECPSGLRRFQSLMAPIVERTLRDQDGPRGSFCVIFRAQQALTEPISGENLLGMRDYRGTLGEWHGCVLSGPRGS